MAWFDRHVLDDPARAAHRLDQAVVKAGVPAALEAASGRFGRRRFLVRFATRGGAVRIRDLDSETLPDGGGPPPAALFAAAASRIETALTTLRRILPPPFTFESGAVGVLRARGPLTLAFRFDEDAQGWSLRDLARPKGPADPVEDPRYLRALTAWESRIAPVRLRWTIGTEPWTYAEGRIDLGDRSLTASPLAAWSRVDGRFTWALEEPVGDEAPFVEPDLEVELNGALELAAFAAAKLGYTGGFQAEGEDGRTWFFGVR